VNCVTWIGRIKGGRDIDGEPEVSQVMLVQARDQPWPSEWSADHATELVCPAVGALSVALEGVAATAEDTISNSAAKVNPTTFQVS